MSDKEGAGERALAPQTPERESARKRQVEIPWLSLSAFLLSLVIAVINAYYTLRGSEMVVRPVEQLLLYRDGTGAASVAVVSAQIQLINTASSEYGDVLIGAELALEDGKVRFPLQGEVKPVFTAEKPPCELGARCFSLPNLLLIEQGNNIFDVPGGTARSLNLSFAISPTDCTGDRGICSAYGDFNRTVAALAGKERDIAIRLTFNSDGTREVRCRLGKLDAGYLGKVGWQTAGCVSSQVKGAPWL